AAIGMVWPLPSLLLTLLVLSHSPSVSAFDQRELQLFDLRSTAISYELLNTKREASSQEIRRAFRRVSMQYIRIGYDEILDNGLPDWRTPMFYYRKWRKMSLAEVMLVFCLAFTVGHYLVLWGVYIERKLAFDDLFRRKASKKKQKQLEEELEQEPLVGPGWRDLLPLAIGRGLYACAVGAPGACRWALDSLADWRDAELQRKRAAKAEAEAAAEEARRREQRKQQKRERREQQLAQVQQQLLAEQQQPLPTPPVKAAVSNGDQAESTTPPALVEGPWSEAEQQLLVKAVARFPSGTPGRWEKIAALLHRAVPDVAARAREAEQQMRRQAAASLNAAFEVNTDGAAVCGESDSDSDADSDGGAGRAQRRRRNKRQKQQQQQRGVTVKAEEDDIDEAQQRTRAW
uniref:SANT domain-containing protein n=1 Tax=Macrostomum lignano TaxID=282301 RepID=A0A1I8JJG6_9PLAT